MADDKPAIATDARFDHIKERIALGFPKLAGSKLDKALGTDEARYLVANKYSEAFHHYFSFM
jgi:hypothetical protein